MAETTPLLRVQLLTGARGFKSLSVRQNMAFLNIKSPKIRYFLKVLHFKNCLKFRTILSCYIDLVVLLHTAFASKGSMYEL